MIDEFLVKSAINIRREFLKENEKLNEYHLKSKNIAKLLEDSINKLNDIKNNKNITYIDSVDNTLKIIDEIEEEYKKINNFIEPIDKKIKKLSKEENDLFIKIKERHKNLSNDEIFNYIQLRLRKEGL